MASLNRGVLEKSSAEEPEQMYQPGILPVPFDFTMSFQPVVSLASHTTVLYEALARGPQGEPSSHVLSQVNRSNLSWFDQASRVQAIELAAACGLANTQASLAINFNPVAVYSHGSSLRSTLVAAERVGLSTDRIVFEVTEQEQIREPQRMAAIFEEYRKVGFRLALDDFGAGYSSLALLADLPADIIKLDQRLIRNIHTNRVNQAIVRAVVRLCQKLNIEIIAEGVETEEECHVAASLGIDLFQGFLFCRPTFRCLGTAVFPPGL